MQNRPGIIKLAGVALVTTLAMLALAGPVTANGNDPVLNQASYWENLFEQRTGLEAWCYKHHDSHRHGVMAGSTVTLDTYGAHWPGDGWGLLVVKAATERTVVWNPSPHVAYQTPDGKDVSHWIVCKASSAITTTTTTAPTTTVPPTTTQPPAPTTSVSNDSTRPVRTPSTLSRRRKRTVPWISVPVPI